MKFARIWDEGEARVAVVTAQGAVPLRGDGFARDMEVFIAAGNEMQRRAAEYAQGKVGIPLAEARLLASLGRPGKIMAIGMNYGEHVREQKAKMPERPIVFAKFNTSILDPDGTITWDPALTDQVDWEVELGIVIGRTARNVSEVNALDYVFGYTVVNDVSARDLQFSDRQWVRAKSLDTFCPAGPVIITADEIPDPQQLSIRSRVNGVTMQDANTSDMIFGVKHLVSFLSRAFTLEPGDLIATGTPSGVGFARKPPIYLKDGDVVEVEVEGIGVLRNTCKTQTSNR